MGPLSTWLYFHRNRRKALPVLGVIVLAVFAVSLTAVLTGSMIASARQGWLKPYERYSLVTASQGILEPKYVRKLKANDNVGRLLPLMNSFVRVMGIFGSDQRLVLGLKAKDLRWFMSRTDLRLSAGQLPKRGKAEIILHEDILKGKGVRLGDEIGREVDDDEFLPGKYRIVGVLTGPFPLALTTYEYMQGSLGMANVKGDRAFLVFARPGGEAELEMELGQFPRDKVTVSTYTKEHERFRREIANMDIMIWILNFVTIVTLSLSVGLLNIIFFMQRMGEYGILAAIGYRRGFLLRRTFSEVLVVTLVGWVAGLFLSQGVFLLISRYIYEPKGIYLTGVDLRVISFTIPIPVMIALFSLFIVFWQLWRLDPVSIVERRE